MITPARLKWGLPDPLLGPHICVEFPKPPFCTVPDDLHSAWRRKRLLSQPKPDKESLTYLLTISPNPKPEMEVSVFFSIPLYNPNPHKILGLRLDPKPQSGTLILRMGPAYVLEAAIKAVDEANPGRGWVKVKRFGVSGFTVGFRREGI